MCPTYTNVVAKVEAFVNITFISVYVLHREVWRTCNVLSYRNTSVGTHLPKRGRAVRGLPIVRWGQIVVVQCTALMWMYSRRYMDPMYRRTLVLQEVLGYHADVICLQEVDEKAFQHYLLPHLNFAGVVPLF
jgi:hypothetical protein